MTNVLDPNSQAMVNRGLSQRISWFDQETQRWIKGVEHICGRVDQQLNPCSASIRIAGNTYFAPARPGGIPWLCAEHALADGDKVKKK